MPSSLLNIIIAGAVAYLFKFDVVKIGEIPHIVSFNKIQLFNGFRRMILLLSPAFTIAALGMVESALCACASNMKKRLLMPTRN